MKLQVVGTAEGNIGKPQNIDEIHKPGGEAAVEPEQPQQKGAAPVKVQPGRPVANQAPAGGFPNRNQQKPAAQAQPKAPAAATKGAGGKVISPIDSLNPYQNRWTIRARITKKGPMRTWNNANGSGSLFSFDVLDTHGGEIRITCFKDLAEKFNSELEEGKIYEISGGQIKFANKKFNPLKHDYEITLDNSSVIELCEGADISVPAIEYQFEQIANLVNFEKNSSVDIIGVILNVSEAANIPSKNGKELVKRELTLADDSGSAIRLTLWGQLAIEFDLPVGSIFAVRGAKVSDFGGRSISVHFSSTTEKNPDLPEAHRLRGWYDETNGTVYNSLTQDFGGGGGSDAGPLPRKSLAEVRDESLGVGQPYKFISRLTVLLVPPQRESYWYPSCPGKTQTGGTCSKRVTQTGSGWHCDKCDLLSRQPTYRYVFSARCADFTGSQWVTFFDEVGSRLLGQPADVLHALKEENSDSITKVLKDAEHKTYSFRMLAKEENYQGEMRVKYQVTNIKETNFVEESRELIQLIQSFQ